MRAVTESIRIFLAYLINWVHSTRPICLKLLKSCVSYLSIHFIFSYWNSLSGNNIKRMHKMKRDCVSPVFFLTFRTRFLPAIYLNFFKRGASSVYLCQCSLYLLYHNLANYWRLHLRHYSFYHHCHDGAHHWWLTACRSTLN